ncbi:hypothetical protein ACFE04_003129 [Oxalis oulophora]
MEVAETDLYYHQMQIMSTDFKRGTTKYFDLPEESRLYHANAVIRDFEESLMLLDDDRSQNYRPGSRYSLLGSILSDFLVDGVQVELLGACSGICGSPMQDSFRASPFFVKKNCE